MISAYVDPTLVYFLILDREQQANAIRRMATQGWSENTIAGATRLSVEQIRRTLQSQVPRS